MENLILREVLVAQEPCKLTSISVHHGEVKWAKVFVEWEVSEVIVNIKEKGILEVCGWLCIRDPIKFV